MITKHRILSLLERCSTMTKATQLHALMITTSLITHTIPLSKLIDFCVDPDSGDLQHARSIFLRITNTSLYIWNSIIRGFSDSHDPLQALLFYKNLQRSGLSPDHFTFPFALKACSAIHDVVSGRCIHSRVIKSGYEQDVYVSATLIHMYASCREMMSARSLFDVSSIANVVAWTTMIAGYVNSDQASQAIALYKQMEVAKAATPNDITMVHLLAACARARDLDAGKQVHCRLYRVGMDFIQSNIVVATALLDMYGRCGSLRKAQQLFDEMAGTNEVSWNTMICAYNQYGRHEQVLLMFRGMCRSGMKPDEVTLLSLLGACGHKGALGLGQGVHGYVEKTSGGDHIALGTSLVDMYAKCGDTESAQKLFEDLPKKDVLVWTSMIIGFAMQGNGEKALNLFKQMEDEGIRPDKIAFMGVMSACSHAGMVDEGHRYFNSMTRVYDIKPEVEHYGCLVDLLSRAGRLQEVEILAKSMPVAPSIAIWGAILRGCENHGEVRLAERIGDCMAEFDPQGSGAYVLLSNIYAGAGRWHGVQRTRELMWKRGVKKDRGKSSVEVMYC